MAEKTKKKTTSVKVEKLPENWNTLPLEKKYDLVNDKLQKLADIDCDWDIDIKLESGYFSYIEWTDCGCVLNEDDARYRPCQFVRKKPVEFGKVVLSDFPPELQAELKDEDWSGEDDGDIPNIIDSHVSGKNWTECLEKTFIRLELLKLGYEMCWECTEYRKEHRKFFKKYFEKMENLYGYGSDNDEDDSGDDIKIDLDDLRDLLRDSDDDDDPDDDDLKDIVIR